MCVTFINVHFTPIMNVCINNQRGKPKPKKIVFSFVVYEFLQFNVENYIIFHKYEVKMDVCGTEIT